MLRGGTRRRFPSYNESRRRCFSFASLLLLLASLIFRLQPQSRKFFSFCTKPYQSVCVHVPPRKKTAHHHHNLSFSCTHLKPGKKKEKSVISISHFSNSTLERFNWSLLITRLSAALPANEGGRKRNSLSTDAKAFFNSLYCLSSLSSPPPAEFHLKLPFFPSLRTTPGTATSFLNSKSKGFSRLS